MNLPVEQKAVYLNVPLKNNWGRSETSLQVTPWGWDGLPATVAEYGIRIPFERAVSAWDGVSVCTKCGAVYAGYQPECTARARLALVHENEYRSREPHHDESTAVGQYLAGKGTVVGEEHRECSGSLKWNLREEFDRQSRFWSMVRDAQGAPKVEWGEEFASSFHPGIREAIGRRLQASRAQMTEFQVQRHQSALEQVAQKMQAAGTALCF